MRICNLILGLKGLMAFSISFIARASQLIRKSSSAVGLSGVVGLFKRSLKYSAIVAVPGDSQS